MATFTPKTRLDREDLDEVLTSIQAEYPALARHQFSLRRGVPGPNGGLLEFYPAWESGPPGRGRPDPGSHVIEILNTELTGRVLKESVAGDMLHLLGAIDPTTGMAVDPTWRALKDVFTQTLTPDQLALEQSIYQELVRRGREHRPFDQYLDGVRIDGYIRAGLFPMVNPGWQRPGTFTDQQSILIEHLRDHLMDRVEPGLLPMLEEFDSGDPERPGPASAGVDLAEGAQRTLEGLANAPAYYGHDRMVPRSMSDAETRASIYERDAPMFQDARPHVTRPFEGITPRESEQVDERHRIEDIEREEEPPTSVALSPAALARLRGSG